MQYVNLGRSGLEVSRLCLGTMNFGPHATEEQSCAIMDLALERGVNFFDTANVYGRQKGEGVTEQILGRWFSRGGRRDKIVLATKVYGSMGDGPNEGKLSALHIRQACEASLKRLKTDYIDVYQMHHVWRRARWEEIWQAMELLVQQGKVLYVGSSNFAGWHLAQACETAKARNFFGPVSEQSLYNLTTRAVELEVIPACQAYGLGFLPWSPLAGGLLAGAVESAYHGSRRSTDTVRKRADHMKPKLEAWQGLCRELSEEPANVALAWLFHRPPVTSAIVGPRLVEQFEGCFRALEIRLEPEVLRRIDEIFPGPGGPAPEAYAW